MNVNERVYRFLTEPTQAGEYREFFLYNININMDKFKKPSRRVKPLLPALPVLHVSWTPTFSCHQGRYKIKTK